MSEELEELKRKLERKDSVIEELTERIETLKSRKAGDLPEEVFEAEMKKRVNDLLSKLQDNHTNIRRLTAERKERDDEIDRLARRVRDLLRIQEEASSHVTMANIAIANCVKTMAAIHDCLEAGTAKELAEAFLIECGAIEISIEPELDAQQELPGAAGAESA